MSARDDAVDSIRSARFFALGKVLRAYRECFDEGQRKRTVAGSPVLFRIYYGHLLLRGRAQIKIAVAEGAVVGFVIVRSQAPSTGAWLLSAIGVVPRERGHGLAKRLFESVASRPLTLTVEEDGPVAFYERLRLRRTGARTLVYFTKAELATLRELPLFEGGAAAPYSIRRINRQAFLLQCATLGESALEGARRRFRFARWGILEVPQRIDVPPRRFPRVVHEIEFTTTEGPAD